MPNKPRKRDAARRTPGSNGNFWWPRTGASLMVTISARAVILATGGLQGQSEFTDNPNTLIGEGHGMALDSGAALVDIEFMQFLRDLCPRGGLPTIFLYPDFRRLTTLINDKGENVLVKHLGEGAKYFAGLQNWDQLAAVVQTEAVEGRGVCIDFSETKSTDWAPNSLTAPFYQSAFRPS